MGKKWLFLKELLRVELLKRGSLTVLIASALRSCRIRLERATSRTGKSAPPATRAFADGPAAIVRVEHVSRPDGRANQLGVLTAEDAVWTLQADSEPLRAPSGSAARPATASGTPYGAVSGRAGRRNDVTPGLEIEMRASVMFTVSLKEAGVEKARAEAKARPGTQRV